jgi:hypothetical protein
MKFKFNNYFSKKKTAGVIHQKKNTGRIMYYGIMKG